MVYQQLFARFVAEKRPSSPYGAMVSANPFCQICDFEAQSLLLVPQNDTFEQKSKPLKPLCFKGLHAGGISRARTYDLHDVNG